MAWIESHDTLARHPKTRRLVRLLNISTPQAIGHLHLLWWWALEYAEQGDLTAYDDADIADAALWDGDPALLREALIASNFLGKLDSRRYMVADWRQLTASYQRSIRDAFNPEWEGLRQAAIRRDGYTCRLCGQPVPRKAVDIDHIIPRSKGGPDTLDNLRVTHAHCNRSRGNRVDGARS